ncbi:ABC transporter ATP-binding protein [Corynebacterium ulcerans]|uniref:ABC transport system n=1 Tax=Corynebacterium ulcerans TaxID=65058 RepID=A0ABD7MV94_CORUL|nr:ABC transporter ATP-binding protein [Corynebacterium ulcerans]QQU26703.1 ABC transporter ATP-binding protein [Corynebacterium ulcerans]SNV08688.1 putative ABC transport system [Corynebacterium ulcerans]SQG53083.1 putative ABC transport system [Corynebacterium ulcerans]SQH03210.1 putative ABC transport system [Corynebacterium ulcerans]
MFDPLLLRRLGELQSADGRKRRLYYLILVTFVGLFDGFAVLILLPVITALTRGESISSWLSILVAISVVSFALRYFSAMVGYQSALDFLKTGHSIIGDKLATLPLGWFTPARTGGISRLVSDRFMVATETLAHLLGTFFREAAALAVLLVGSWFFDPLLGLALVIIAPCALAVMKLASVIRGKASQQALPSGRELSARIVEYVRHQPVLRATGRSHNFMPLTQALERDRSVRFRELWQSTGALLLNGIVVQFFVVALISVSAHLFVEGSLSGLEAIAIIGITLRFTRCLEQMGTAFVGLDVGRVAVAEAEPIVGSPALPEPVSPVSGDGSGRVEFHNVTFGYTEKPVVNDISFVVEPGTVTAIVGPSGSGKTTLVRLASRFWDVNCGAVLIDGVDVRDLGTTQLMSKLSMVFQDVYLFDDTLLANIRVGRPEASEEEIRKAAELAGVTSIAERLGWETPVGEGGALLSGGERQRVSVARALLKQAPIVLFDEATSALDQENEENILISVEKLRERSTFIVIAHKLDTIRSADQIIVLDESGRICQKGTHAQLYAEPGLYRRFWERRKAAKGWALS